jgi:predicted transcriptional regulator
MNSDVLKKSLLQIGVSSLGADLYLLLLFSKTKSVSDIAKKLNTNRVRIYKEIDQLMVLGLIIDKDKLTLESPTKILSELRFKKVELERLDETLTEVLPEILSQYHLLDNKPKIQIFEGKPDFIKLINQCIEELEIGGELLWIAEGEEMYEIMNDHYFNVEMATRRAKKQVIAKILAGSKNKTLQSPENLKKEIELNRQVKYLPEKINTLGTVAIAGSKIINWNTVYPRATVIDDIVMARVYTDLFNFMWDSL